MGLDDKSNITVDDGSTDQDGLEAAVGDRKGGTADDRADMFRLGKRQELRVCL